MKTLFTVLTITLSMITFSANAVNAAGDITRGRFLEWVMLAAQHPLKIEPSTDTFSDVPFEHPYYPYIQTAKELGYVSGYEGTNRFGPDNLLNKQEAAKILLNTFGYSNITSCFSAPYSDVSVNDWGCPYIQKLKSLKALNGLFVRGQDIKFYPAGNVNQATAMKMVAVMYAIDKGYESPFGYIWDVANDDLTGGYENAVAIGQLYEQNVVGAASPVSFSLDAPLQLKPNDTATLSVSTQCSKCTYYWEVTGGQFSPITEDFSRISYKAPRNEQTVHLYVFVSDGQGATSMQKQTVDINRSVDETPTAVTFNSSYNQSDEKFHIAYQVASDITYLKVESSFDQSTWTQEFEKNISSSRNGSAAFTISDSDKKSTIYFRIGTKSSSNSSLLFSSIQTLQYEPPAPYIEKGTEIPVAPHLYSLSGTHVSSNITISWRKVLDSQNNDNASYYEVLHADNFRFDNATIYRAANTATGDNLYETISWVYSGAADNTTHYFKVRAVNQLGEGDWSAYESAITDIQDWPFFTNNYSPENEAQNVAKLPDFCWNADDPDGDDLEFRLEWGFGPNPSDLTYDTSFNEGQECFDFASEGKLPFGPNKTVYWRVLVREDGYYKDYYGGQYISSPIQSFTTVASGQDLSIVSAKLVGEVKYDAYVDFEITIKNNGTENVPATWIDAFYLKNGVESEFLHGSVLTPASLAPGGEATLTVQVKFRDDLFTSPSGRVYDNILISGASAVVFKTKFISDQDTNPANNRFAVGINYEDLNGPVFDVFVINTDNISSSTQQKYSKQGGQVQVVANVRDDVAVVSATIEYKLFDSDAQWTLLETFAGNSDSLNLEYNAKGEKVGSTGNSYEWQLPADIVLTEQARIRMTAVDSQNNATTKISEPFTIAKNHLFVSIAPLAQTSYDVGTKVNIGVTVDSYYPVEHYAVTLDNGRNTWTLIDVTEGAVPSTLVVTLPNDNAAVSPTAKFKVRVSAGYSNLTEVESQGFVIKANTTLPEPFRTAHKLYDPPVNPGNTTEYNSYISPAFVELDNSGLAHMVFDSSERYFNTGTKQFVDNSRFFYVTVTNNGVASAQINVPSEFNVIDFKLASDGKPYLLLENMNRLAYATVDSGQLSAINYLLNERAPEASITAKGSFGFRYPYTIADRIYEIEDIRTGIKFHNFIDGQIGSEQLIYLTGGDGEFYKAEASWLVSHIGEVIYFVDVDKDKLVKIDLAAQRMTLIGLPFDNYDHDIDQLDGRPKMALTALDSVLYMVMRGELYKLDGDQLVLVKALIHEHEGKTANFKENWHEVDAVYITAKNSALSIYIDWDRNLSIPNGNEVTILDYSPVNNAFSLPVYKPQRLVRSFPRGLYSAYSSTQNAAKVLDIGNGKLLIAFDNDFVDRTVHLEHKDVGISLFDMNTGAASFLGSFKTGLTGPFAWSSSPLLRLSQNTPYLFLGGKVYRIDLGNFTESTIFYDEPIFNVFQNSLYVSYGYGVEYDGRDGNTVENGTYRAKIELAPLGLLRGQQLAPATSGESTLSSSIVFKSLEGFTVFDSHAYVESKHFYPLNSNFTLADNSLCQFSSEQGRLLLDVDSMLYLGVTAEWINGHGQFNLLNKDCSVNRVISVPYGDSSIWFNGQLKGMLTDQEFIIYGYDSPNTYLFKYDIASNQLAPITLPLKLQNVRTRTSINDNKDTVISWTDGGIPFVAFTNVGGDIIAPTVSLNVDKNTASPGEVIKLSWHAADNQGQLKDFKLYVSKNDGVEELLVQLTDANITTHDYTIASDTTLNKLKFRLLVTDQEDNWGQASTEVLVRQPLSIDSFATDKAVYQRGENIAFSWTVTGADSKDNIQLFKRQSQNSDWVLVAENLKVQNYRLNTDELIGQHFFKLVARDKAQETSVTIEGIWLQFDEQQFSPAGITYADYAAPVLVFSWDANIEQSDNWYAQLYIKTDAETEFTLFDTAKSKSFEWEPSTVPQVVSWYIAVQLQGVEFTSQIQTVNVAELKAITGVEVNITGDHTSTPAVNLSFDSLAAGVHVLLLRSVNFADYRLLQTLNVNQYTDSDVEYGDTVAYRLVAGYGENFAAYTDSQAITVAAKLPAQISFAANSEISSGSTLTFSPADTVPVYEYYEVLVGQTGQAEDFWQSIIKTHNREAVLPQLSEGQIYTAKVYALTPLGDRLAGVNDEVTFAVPYSYSTLSTPPAINTARADNRTITLNWTPVHGAEQYSVYRLVNEQWHVIHSLLDTTYQDTSASDNVPYRYKVSAENPISSIESTPTDWLVIDTIPPTVQAPANIVVAAQDRSGTPAAATPIVTFLASATASEGQITHDAPAVFPLGETSVVFKATDAAGNEGSAQAVVTVKDQTPPSLTLVGDSTVYISIGSEYSEPGVTIIDNVDGDISHNVVIEGVLDVNTVGSYVLTYKGADNAGNQANSVQRTVVVQQSAVVSLSLSAAQMVEAEQTIEVTASLNRLVSQDVTVTIGVSGTAVSGVDFDVSSLQVPIKAGELSAAVTITAKQDSLAEGNESIIVDIVEVAGGNVLESGHQQQTITLLDDDLVNVRLSVSSTSISENDGTNTITAILSQPTFENVTVTMGYSGTAVLYGDYDLSSASLVIVAGQTTGIVTLTAKQDSESEPSESVVIDINGVSGGNAVESGNQQQTVSIVDDDTPSVALSASSSSISESGGISTITATLSQPTFENVTLTLGYSGTAVANQDYSASSSSIVITAGQVSGIATLVALTDTFSESNETVIVTIDGVSGGGAIERDEQQLTVSIIDEGPVTAGISIDNAELSESGGSGLISVALTRPVSEATVVKLGFVGEATLDVDYTLSATELTIPAGQTTAQIAISIVQDLVVETTETVSIFIQEVSGNVGLVPATNQVLVSIIDDDTVSVSLSVSSSSIFEGVGSTVITADLNQASSTDTTITVGLSGTAIVDKDFILSSMEINIPAGSLSGRISASAIQDEQPEPQESIILAIDSITGNVVEQGEQIVTINIVDDDSIKVSLNVNDSAIEEGGKTSLTVSLDQVTDEIVSVGLQFSGAAISQVDYDELATVVEIPAGKSSMSLILTTKQDSAPEPNESIVVDIISVAGGLAVEDGEQQQTVTIADDDVSRVNLYVSAIEIPEVGFSSNLNVTLDKATYEEVKVTIGFSGKAAFGSDYSVSSTVIRIPAGETFGSSVVTAIQDNNPEPDESISVKIDSVSGGNAVDVDKDERTIYIMDDDGIGVVLSVDELFLSENSEQRTISVTLGQITNQEVIVSLALSGTAQRATDYSLLVDTITIPAGRLTGQVTLISMPDSIPEGDESIVIEISAVTGEGVFEKEPQAVTLQLIDDDNVSLSMSVDVSTVEEADGSAVVSVVLNAETYEDVFVNLGYSGSAVRDVDYTGAVNTITVKKGETEASVTLSAIQDASVEYGDEIVVAVSSIVGGNVVSEGLSPQTIKIIDDDKPTISLSISKTEISENGGESVITASLNQASDMEVKVIFSYSGSAESNNDYTPISSITITPGNTSASGAIKANQDDHVEPMEDIIVAVIASTGGTVDADGQQPKSIIINNDDVSYVSLEISPTSISEFYEKSVITVKLSAPTYDDVLIDFEVGGTATSVDDYKAISERIVIPEGGTFAAINLEALPDNVMEKNETVTIKIISATGGDVLMNGIQEKTVSIVDYAPISPFAGWLQLLLNEQESSDRKVIEDAEEQ